MAGECGEARTVDDFTGLHLLENFLTEQEEVELAEHLEADPNWKES